MRQGDGYSPRNQAHGLFYRLVSFTAKCSRPPSGYCILSIPKCTFFFFIFNISDIRSSLEINSILTL